MMKHIDLAVDMKKRQYSKEALSAYRNMCQAVNINSLEEVIKYFLQTATSKAEQAVAASAVGHLWINLAAAQAQLILAADCDLWVTIVGGHD